MKLQYRKTERIARLRQLADGAVIVTHVRPMSKRGLPNVGQLVTLRNGYAKAALSNFGPEFVVLNAYTAATAEDITAFSYAHQSKYIWQDVAGQKEWAEQEGHGTGPFEVLLLGVVSRIEGGTQ
jgi:hypothetical protein